MFEGFTDWLDEYLREHKPSAIFKAAVSLMAFAGLLGTILSSQAIRAGAFVTTIFCLMSCALLLLIDRRAIKQDRDRYLRRLNWYYKILTDLSPEPLLAVDNWQQRVEIEPNGDVHEVLTLEAVAPRDLIYFVRLAARSRWDQPRKQLRKIRMVVRGLDTTGKPGPRWHIMSSWEGDKLISYLDLDPPVRRGKVIRFQVTRSWPAKCQPMMRYKQPEDFLLRATNALEIRRAEYSIVLPRKLEAVYELIGEGEPDVQLTADVSDQDGKKVYKWCADKIPAMTFVGIRLELK
jgi:hypothetical protein